MEGVEAWATSALLEKLVRFYESVLLNDLGEVSVDVRRGGLKDDPHEWEVAVLFRDTTLVVGSGPSVERAALNLLRDIMKAGHDVDATPKKIERSDADA